MSGGGEEDVSTPAQRSPQETVNDPLLVDEEADGLAQYLADPSEDASDELLGPPAKRLKLNTGDAASLSAAPARDTGTDASTARVVLSAAPFDKAFSSPGFQGSSAIYFRLSLTEGSQHIIKKECAAVRYGLSLWAKAVVTLLDSEDLFQPRTDNETAAEESAPPPEETPQEAAALPTSPDQRPAPAPPSPSAAPASPITATSAVSPAAEAPPLKQDTETETAAVAADVSPRTPLQPPEIEDDIEEECKADLEGADTEPETGGVLGEKAEPQTIELDAQGASVLGDDTASSSSGCEHLVLEAQERQHMLIGLKHLEGLTFAPKRKTSLAGGSSPTSTDDPDFSYESGHCLTICGLEFYQYVNKIIVSVISRRGQFLGRHVLEFLQQVQQLGAKLAANPNSRTLLLTDGVSPPPTHSLRTAKTYATLAAIGHLRAKKRGGGGDGGVPASPQQCVFPVLPPVPPPRIDLVAPARAWTSIDTRMHALPQWVLSVVQNLVLRYDNKLFSQLQTAWLQTYGSHVDLMMWGFPNFQDLLVSIPGVLLRREGADFRVLLQRQGAWMDMPPRPGWTQRPPSSMDLSVFVSNSTSKVPPEISTRLLLLLNEHNGCNIGHLQQLWRKECGEPLDFSSLGFAKFSDLLAEVPGITLRKEESTVTAHL